MGFMKDSKRMAALLLSVLTVCSLMLPAAAAEIKYMPDVTAEMSEASYWAALYEDAQDVILTPEEIRAFNEDTYIASGTMVMDLRTVRDTFDGRTRNETIRSSATADAKYYFGWTYGPDGKKAEWPYYQKMIDNCIDPKAKNSMPVRYAVAVERTVLQVFPSADPIWDDPKDEDFNYQYLSAVQVNDPLVLYTTSADGKYYMARSKDCSGWIPAADVAVCKDKAEWESAWVIPEEKTLVVYGNKEYTDESYTAPETARRMLAQGTRLELVTDLEPDQLVNNRSPYHNYVVYLPVRLEDGSYEKKMALLPETAKVSVGFLPLTMENIAMVMLENLGDAYGWGGMMDVEDCSGLIRTVYACFGLEIGRNGNWQWNMSIEKIDMANMALEEKLLILDEMPLGSALCFPGHEMMYLGKADGKHYVISTVSSIMSPETGKRLRTRDVMINTLDVKRANGQNWLEALNMAFMPCYAKLEGKTYDFPELQWYHDGVAYALKNKLVDNREDGYFGVYDAATRGTVVSALWRLDGRSKVSAESKFVDVPADSKYFDAVHWAEETGVACGYGAGAFGPEDTVTREQLVTFLWRYAQQAGYDVSVGEDTNILSYDDVFRVSEYAVPAMQWACGAGLVEGRSGADGRGLYLAPKEKATKAQLSVMLERFGTWLETAEYAPQTFDLAKGTLTISAGAEEYAAHKASGAEAALPPAYVSQDGGESWIPLKGDLIVTASAPTDNGILPDYDAPYGDIALTLDGVNTTGDLMLSPNGTSVIVIRGAVSAGTVVTGLEQELTVCGDKAGAPDSLTVGSSVGYGIVANGTICIKDLDGLYVTAVRDGILTENGDIILENVQGTVRGGEGYAALKTGEDGEIRINGEPVTETVGPEFVLAD